jgi:hypothetical protein
MHQHPHLQRLLVAAAAWGATCRPLPYSEYAFHAWCLCYQNSVLLPAKLGGGVRVLSCLVHSGILCITPAVWQQHHAPCHLPTPL